MADRFYSVVKGESRAFQVTEGAATSSEAFELRINDSIYAISKVERDNMLLALREYLLHKEGTPIS